MAVNDMDVSQYYWVLIYCLKWMISDNIWNWKSHSREKIALDFIAENKWSYIYLKYKSRYEFLERKWLEHSLYIFLRWYF